MDGSNLHRRSRRVRAIKVRLYMKKSADVKKDQEKIPAYCDLSIFENTSALDKLLGQLGIYAAWLYSIAYLQKQMCIFIYFYTTFFSVITRFLIA